jgi:HSP20 family molecular chaperone IbpA
MAREVVFDSPFLLGFDQTRILIERVSRASDNYPPYNVEALAPHHLRISIAVAGFTRDQLRVELRGQSLTVTASKDRTGDTQEREYVHRGIALRGFVRSFVLSDGWDVERASLAYGLLHVDLTRPDASDEVQIIPIEILG